MRIVLDTYVFMSGVFFGGPPGVILEAWRADRLTLAVSLEILSEYERVGTELAERFPGVDPAPFLEAVTLRAELRDCPPLDEQVCADPDDDKFLACALATCTKHIVTGDKLLLQVSGYRGVEVLRPREFADHYLGTSLQPEKAS